MIDKIFDINEFNVYSDDMYYYFFRALNMSDNNDFNSGITVDENGNISRIRTNLDRYEEIPMYSVEDELSLEQIFNHIKMHQRKDTNCISITSNANTAITYGRGNYKDRYVMIKIPKSDINKTVYEAGLYMLKQINERLNLMIENHELTEEQILLLREVDAISSQEELLSLKNKLILSNNPETTIFENGLERVTTSTKYLSLNELQNLEKNKIVLKLDIIKKNLLKGISNSMLIQTIGNAFSSLELIHYREISKEKIIEIPKEIMDIFGLIQQLPLSIPELDKFKREFLSRIQNIKLNGSYEYEDFKLDDDDFSIDNIYNLTGGKVSYYMACEMYRKAFYFAKSKIRAYNSINMLRKIMNENPEYESIFNYMEQHTYGIEPEITTRISENKIQISESVSLDFLQREKKLFEYLKKLNIGQLKFIINNPTETLKILLNNFIDEELDSILQDKDNWYANSIIDMLDLERLGVRNNLSLTQRKDIIDALIAHNFYEKYLLLRNNKLSNKEIANLIFTSLIRNSDQVNLNDLFSLEELEYFIGYNRISGTNLNLRSYQKTAVDNIDKIFAERQFASVILPTGAGKSFVALAEMHKYSNKKILYLAPNTEILNQIKRYIKEVYTPEEHLGDKEFDPIRRIFPNIVFDTYQHLRETSAENIINDNYSLIVFDELHRTGAKEWKNIIEKLLNNQNEKVKVLGITATPERDVDLKDMTDYWARYYGYSNEEIVRGKHIAINMDLVEAITLGYVVNPRVVNFEYSLISDGSLEDIRLSIEDIKNESLKSELLRKYEHLRRNVEKSIGIEKILSDNLKSAGKYIVFLPVTKNNGNTYEDADGNEVDRENAKGIIAAYRTLIKQYMFSNEYFKQYGQLIINIYNKINLNNELSIDELDFLYQEKENILLLAEINMKNKPFSLSTQNNMMIKTIINYLGWEMLSEIELTKKLNIKMRDKIEDYAMLGSFSDKKNKSNLDSFNNNQSKKIKFMFVMNKLNEGVHVNGIDGIIWLRPLDENSRILYLQQLGRCISATKTSVITEEDRPLIIDLVNNSLKVKLDKGELKEQRDLDKLLLVKTWIDSNGRLPSISSSFIVEKEYAYNLYKIYNTYLKYFQNSSLLDEKNSNVRILIREILEVGSEIDLWNMSLPKYEIERIVNYGTKRNNDLLGTHRLTGVFRDFVELNEQVNSYNGREHVVISWVKNLEEYCSKYQEWPKQKNIEKMCQDGTTSHSLALWLDVTSGYSKNRFKYNEFIYYDGRNLKDVIDELFSKYGKKKISDEDKQIQRVKNLVLYCNKFQKLPKFGVIDFKFDDGTTPHQLADWLSRGSGYQKKKFKYSHILYEDGRSLKEVIDELFSKYGMTKNGTDASIVAIVDKIVEFCHKYQKWPKRSNFNDKCEDGTTSDRLANWLNITSGYMDKNFKFDSVIYHDGRSIKQVLDELFNKYGSEKRNLVFEAIKCVKNLEEYCSKYHEWPKPTETGKKCSDGTTSKSLAGWYDRTMKSKAISRYSEILYSNGKTLKEVMLELHSQYGYIKIGSEEAIISYVVNLIDYCETFNEWPKQNDETKKSKYGKTSSQLAIWLYDTSGYMNKKFKYKDIIFYDGRKIETVIDELYGRYGRISKISKENVVKWVRELVEYCETFKKLPSREEHENKTSSGITAGSLYEWLAGTSKYTSGDFKYNDVLYDDGRSVKEVIDELYSKYKVENRFYDGYVQKVIKLVKNLMEYCDKYNEFPKSHVYDKMCSDKTTSNELYKKLYNLGYFTGKFKYTDVLYSDGRTVKQVIDQLYNQYGKTIKGSDESIVQWVRDLAEYCEKYQQWPSQSKNKAVNICTNGRTSREIYNWLYNTSGYSKGKFKYADVLYDDGRSVKEVIDDLYYLYKGKKIAEYNETKKAFDEVSAFCEVVDNVSRENNHGRKIH